MTILTRNWQDETRHWNGRATLPPHTIGDRTESRNTLTETTPRHATATRRIASPEQPLLTESGKVLDEVDVAYETIGRLNAQADNAVLVCHPLSADTHAARRSRSDRPGWWEAMIGEGRPIDPSRHFVISANVLGGCFGTTGPTSIDPNTGEPWGPRFPVVTVGDMVRVQRRLLDALGIEKPITVIGGGLGALVALELTIREPDRVGRAVVLGAAARRHAQTLALGSLARRAVRNDPNYRSGWYAPDRRPNEGVSIARGLLHASERSPGLLDRNFGRSRRDETRSRFTLEHDHSVEWYLDATGSRFADRFDANAGANALRRLQQRRRAPARSNARAAPRRARSGRGQPRAPARNG